MTATAKDARYAEFSDARAKRFPAFYNAATIYSLRLQWFVPPEPPEPSPQTVAAGKQPEPVEATTRVAPNIGLPIVMVQGPLGLATGLLMIAGAIQMLRLRSYQLATAACVAAMVPVTIVWLLGLPMGIWALRVLRRPQVQALPNEPKPIRAHAGGETDETEFEKFTISHLVDLELIRQAESRI